MEDAANLGKDQVIDQLSSPGLFLFLGYHPRANLDLALEFVLGVARSGSKAFVLDCDHTVVLDRERQNLEDEEPRRVLISHPEDLGGLVGDLEASSKIEGIGVLLVNRPSSIIDDSDNLKRFEAKRELWTRASPYLRTHKVSHPVIVIEDTRRYDEVEYKVHPALYYQSNLVLDPVERGKDVEQYRVLKRRL